MIPPLRLDLWVDLCLELDLDWIKLGSSLLLVLRLNWIRTDLLLRSLVLVLFSPLNLVFFSTKKEQKSCLSQPFIHSNIQFHSHSSSLRMLINSNTISFRSSTPSTPAYLCPYPCSPELFVNHSTLATINSDKHERSNIHANVDWMYSSHYI